MVLSPNQIKMAPVSSAKSAYTIKKKALTRHIERTTPWLTDPNVELHRLEEARTVCKVAWDAFSAAHEKLMEILSEDEAQQAEMEARELEVGELEDSLLDLSGKLADLIALRGREQDQHEKQKECERVQREKTDQLALRRLQVANLYSEAKRNLSQLLEKLNIEELPSAEQLVLAENLLVPARCVIQEASRVALEVAGLNADMPRR